MQNVLIFGAGEKGLAILEILQKVKDFNIIAIIDKDKNAPGILAAQKLGIPFLHTFPKKLETEIHIIFNTIEENSGRSILNDEKKPMMICEPILSLILNQKEAIRQLTKKTNDLNEMRTMLEAIIHSSDDAISVVDENGKGSLINPAYTRLTGLTEKEIIGKPATTDIFRW